MSKDQVGEIMAKQIRLLALRDRDEIKEESYRFLLALATVIETGTKLELPPSGRMLH